jgi:hypothetical protein
MPIAELEAKIIAPGIVMSRRQINRHCESGTFDSKKSPGRNNVEEWFTAPASVDRGIADIKGLQEERSRRDESRRDATGHVAQENSNNLKEDMSGHDATKRDTSEPEKKSDREVVQPDSSRHVATPDAMMTRYVERLEGS